MNQWAAILPLADAGSLAPHRLAGYEGLEQGDELWLRGRGEIPREVPWREIFALDGGETLRRPGELLSAGRLPGGTWQKLSQIFGVERPALRREGLPPVRATVRLVPSPRVRPSGILATSAEHWLAFVSEAPEVRLRPLRFAQTETGRVFVSGEPLPSMPGDYFTLQEQIAAPSGQTWAPALSVATLRAALALAEKEIAVLLADGAWLRIPARAWQPVSRAAVRALAQASRDEY